MLIFFRIHYIILKIKDIFTLQISKFIHKCINYNIIGNFRHRFKDNKDVHSYLTRTNYNKDSQESTNKLTIPFGRTTHCGLKQIKVNGPRIWNSLPLAIRNTNSLLKFKNSIKNNLLETYK